MNTEPNDYQGSDEGVNPPDGSIDSGQTTQSSPVEKKLTAVSYAVLLLLVVVWPVAQFLYLDSQLDLAKNIEKPIYEIYFPTILMQLATILIVLLAVRSEGRGFKSIGLQGFSRWTVLQAAGFFILANLILSMLQLFIASESPGSFAEIAGILPRTSIEKGVWVILCAIVAFCEEMTFRGYLITRISEMSRGRIWIGVLASTLSFASGHLYQGLGGFALIFVYGLMFAGLFLSTKSLYACIIAHFMQDAIVLLFPGMQ